jgi:hypothetical protein
MSRNIDNRINYEKNNIDFHFNIWVEI